MGAYTDGRVTQFRSEFEAQFEVRQSYLRETVLKEAVIKGEQAVFLTSGSNGAEASTRGPTGKIPARANYRNTNVAVLKEAHDKIHETGFIDFVSQGDTRKMIQHSNMTVINREMDREIVDALSEATTTVTGALTYAKVLEARRTLTRNAVDVAGDVYCVITADAEAQLYRIPQFTSIDYVNLKPLVDGAPKFMKWLGIIWIVKPDLPGFGTNAANCFMYHRNAIGHAVNKGGITTALGYNDEDDYTYGRVSVFHGAKLLQNTGVVKIIHDDTAALS